MGTANPLLFALAGYGLAVWRFHLRAPLVARGSRLAARGR